MQDKAFERTLIALGIIAVGVLLFAGIANAAATVCQIGNGCTGTSSSPAYGKVLVGGQSGEYEFVATSTFGQAAAGTVTSVTAATPNSSLTVGGTNPVTTSGTINFDLNLTNTNFWQARQNFTNATSSGLEATSTNVFFDGYASALLEVSASHQLTAYAGSSNPCTNQLPTTLSALGALGGCVTVSNAMLAHSTIVLNSQTLTLGDSGDTITAASSTLLANNNTFSGNNIFSASTTIGGGSITTGLTVNGTATTTAVVDTGITSALGLFNANHQLTAYGGASACTNQFVTAISAIGGTTCATVANAALAHSTIVVNSTTLTLGDAGDTITAASSTLLSNNNTFSGNNMLTASTTIGGGGITSGLTVNGGATTTDEDNAWVGITTPTRYVSVSVASTTWATGTSSNAAVIAGSTLTPFAGTIKSYTCLASTTNAFLGVSLFIGSTLTTPNYIIASNTVGTIVPTANNTFTKGQQIGMFAGTSTSFAGNLGVDCTLDVVQTS